jgi:protein O-mannosyl-transferase
MTRCNAKSAALIAMLITAVVHWQATTFELLLYDDPVYVSENPYVTQGLTWESFRWALNTGYFGNWHPLTWLSLQLDLALGGGSSIAFHRTNVLLHVAQFFMEFIPCTWNPLPGLLSERGC